MLNGFTWHAKAGVAGSPSSPLPLLRDSCLAGPGELGSATDAARVEKPICALTRETATIALRPATTTVGRCAASCDGRIQEEDLFHDFTGYDEDIRDARHQR